MKLTTKRNFFKKERNLDYWILMILVVGDGPTLIIVNSMIRSISKIDDYKMVSYQYCKYCTC